MCANEEVRQRVEFFAASPPVAAECRRSKGRTSPRKTAALDFVDVEQFIQCCDIWPRHKQLRVDDQIDMERRFLTEQLKLLNGPVAPGTCRVYAVNPDIGVDEYPGTPVVARETSGEHGVILRQRCLRREGSP